jgi:hypothetical protein
MENLISSTDTHYKLITATELQAATALRRYIQYDPYNTRSTYTNTDHMSSRFLEHMFLDDLCTLGGDTSANAVVNFHKCLQLIAGIHTKTKSAMRQVREPHESKLNDLIEGLHGQSKKTGMDHLLRDHGNWKAGLEKYITAYGRTTAERDEPYYVQSSETQEARRSDARYLNARSS